MFPVQQGKQGVVVELQGDGPLFGEGGDGARDGARVSGPEGDGGGVQAGAGSSSGWALSAPLPAASRPESEFGCAACTVTEASRADQRERAGEVQRLQPRGTAGDLAGMAAGAGEKDGEGHADARAVERVLLVPEQRLERLQPCILLRLRHLMWRAGGRRARAGRVFEAVGLGEADLADQAPWSARTRPRSRPGCPAMKSEDSARSGRASRSRSTTRQEVVRGVAAVHRRQHPVAAALHRQVQEGHQLRQVAMGGDQVVVHVARVAGGVAQPEQAGDLGQFAQQPAEAPGAGRPGPRRDRR